MLPKKQDHMARKSTNIINSLNWGKKSLRKKGKNREKMNEWVRKSVKIANSKGYLDRLSEVYPVRLEVEREISSEIKSQIKRAYDRKAKLNLIRALLKLEKFPIKDPYVAFLRRRKGLFLTQNPKAVSRIAKTLLSMSFEELIEGCEEPKEFNRQIGTLFRKWLPKLGHPFIPQEDFERYNGIAFLEGSDEALMNYANETLGCNLDKGPDFLVKVGNRHIIGEAKFLTDYGGHQNAQFEDALRLIRSREGRVIRVGVLDGVVWIESNTKMFRTICKVDGVALSALLLREFLESLKK